MFMFRKKAAAPSLEHPMRLFGGMDFKVPLPDGRKRRFVNFDHAATTPPLRAVLDHVNRCAEWYSSVHRGAGFKSAATTKAHHIARETLGRFFDIDPEYHVLIFCGNTTDAVNRMAAHMYSHKDATDGVVLCSVLEHHSNLLPWHGAKMEVDHIRAKSPCGMLDLEHLEEQLKRYEGRVRLICVTGASNITGLVQPIAEMAAMAHAYGAKILVDAAQLAAHRPITMGKAGSPFCIDFLMFSGHKMYAPFGSGGLIGPREFFENSEPAVKGGGAVDFVELDSVEWTGMPDRAEAGTPNVLGILAMAKAAETLSALGMDAVARHECALMRRLTSGLKEISEITMFGGCEKIDDMQRVAVMPIQSSKYPHAHLAAILGHEWGIGVRNGCFCAQPYTGHLLQITATDRAEHLEYLKKGDRSVLPGFVRISMGLANTEKDVDWLLEALRDIHANGSKLTYRQNNLTGEFEPENPPSDPDAFLRAAGFPDV
jgi:selenocysteine lyase/cysteine desulfurase